MLNGKYFLNLFFNFSATNTVEYFAGTILDQNKLVLLPEKNEKNIILGILAAAIAQGHFAVILHITTAIEFSTATVCFRSTMHSF